MTRIDTHHHVLPDLYRKALRENGIRDLPGLRWPEWSPDAAIEAMETLRVDKAIVSISAPGTTFLDEPDDAPALARDVNEHARGLVAGEQFTRQLELYTGLDEPGR